VAKRYARLDHASDAVTYTLRYNPTLITEANWGIATTLTNNLPGVANTFTATVPSSSGTLYFALKSQGAEGAFSALSNNAFWPHDDVYLPVMRH
jgi:hypothetical protein